MSEIDQSLILRPPTGGTGFRAPGLGAAALAVAAVTVLAAGCEGGRPDAPGPVVPGGDPERGLSHMADYGCGSCHTIPGLRGANATVGPPLTEFGLRSYIAGALPNSPDNLIVWIMHPHRIEPGTAMPHLGVSEAEARDIAAYLYTLR